MMFWKKKPAEPNDPEDEDDDDPLEVDADSPVELKKAALAPKKSKGGVVGLVVAAGAVTLVAGGGGVGLGMRTAAVIEQAIAEREAAKEEAVQSRLPLKYSGDMVLTSIEPVITNLAVPSDTWIRLETAMVFRNGALENPQVTAAEIRQDILAYLRTVKLAQLEGASAFQHLREDLNERAALRTNGAVTELVIQTMVVQ